MPHYVQDPLRNALRGAVPLGIGAGSGSPGLLAGIAVPAAGVLAFGGAGWYVWRRWAG